MAYEWEAEEARDARDWALDHGDYDEGPDPSDYADEADTFDVCPDCGGTAIGVEPEDRSVGIFGTAIFCESDEDCRWTVTV